MYHGGHQSQQPGGGEVHQQAQQGQYGNTQAYGGAYNSGYTNQQQVQGNDASGQYQGAHQDPYTSSYQGENYQTQQSGGYQQQPQQQGSYEHYQGSSNNGGYQAQTGGMAQQQYNPQQPYQQQQSQQQQQQQQQQGYATTYESKAQQGQPYQGGATTAQGGAYNAPTVRQPAATATTYPNQYQQQAASASAQGGGAMYPPAKGAAPPPAGGGQMGMRPGQAMMQQQQMQQQPTPPEVVPDYVHTCDPQQLSLTAGVLPSQTSTAARAHVPLGIVLQPLSASSVECPTINFGAVGIVRCKQCRAYMNPYVKWTDGGARWRCNLCGSMNDTPSGYYSAIDPNTQLRADIMERKELIYSTVEVVATPHYMIRAPMPCVFFFVLDVSKAAVSSGMLARACATIHDVLDKLPGGKRTMIGFITFDSKVHYYSLNGKGPRMHVLPDLDDIFLPEPRDLLTNLFEAKKDVEHLLQTLPAMHEKTEDVEAALGPALEAAHQVMKPMGGRLSLFSATLPSIGNGRLMNRDNPNLLGKPDEHKLLLPATEYYKEKAFQFSHVQITIDVYLFSCHYTDVATLNSLAKFTGGQTNRFPAYFDSKDGEEFYRLLSHALTREQGWESVIRVRVGKGYKVTDFFGNFRLRSTDLLTVPCIDSDKTYALQLAVDEKGVKTPSVSVQSALLYTTSFGERRIRVHTLCVPVTSFTTHIYQSVNSSVLTLMLFKQAIAMVTSSSFDKAREHIRQSVTALLRSYSYTSNAYSHSQTLQLPENLNTLPLQCLGLLKHEAFRDRNVPSDQRATIHSLMYPLGLGNVEISVRPRLIPIHNLDGKSMPEELQLTASVVDSTSVLLLDNGRHFLVRIGNRVDPKWLNTVFQDADSKKGIKLRSYEENCPVELERVYQVLDSIKTPFHKGTTIVKEGDSDELLFFSSLIQDRSFGEQSLAEYMQFIVRR